MDARFHFRMQPVIPSKQNNFVAGHHKIVSWDSNLSSYNRGFDSVHYFQKFFPALDLFLSEIESETSDSAD